jgi:hypothetical protein
MVTRNGAQIRTNTPLATTVIDRRNFVPSIINERRVTGQDLLSLFIKDIGDLVDMKLMAALPTTHPHPATRTCHL